MNTKLLRLYLKNGGSPNYRSGVNQKPLVASATLMKNFESYKLLIDYGADVWQQAGPSRWSPRGPLPPDQPRTSSIDEWDIDTAIYLAARNLTIWKNAAYIDYAIDKKLLNGIDSKRIGYLIHWVESYSLRDDDVSRNIVRVIRRIMQDTGYPGDSSTEKVLAFARQMGW